MEIKPGYLPTLDGWRAIAVVLVILCHDSLYKIGPISDLWFQENGLHGVDIFFGISGLLICSRLLEEEEAQGSISLRNFYIRRAFRILPPAYFYLLAALVLRLFSIIPVTFRELFASAFFLRNYSRFSVTPGHVDWYTGHFWSLAVEEHFYLILPGILCFAPRRWRVGVLSGLTCLVCAWRLYRQWLPPWDFPWQHTDTRLDALLIPAILAIALRHPGLRAIATKLARYWWVAAAALLCLVTWLRFERLAPLALSILIPSMLVGTVLRPFGWFATFLELSPVRWVGRVSYSLYLWQNLFFTGHYLPNLRPLGFLQSFPLRWLALFAVATASYYLLEKPLVRLGHRLAPPATPGRPESAAPDSVLSAT